MHWPSTSFVITFVSVILAATSSAQQPLSSDEIAKRRAEIGAAVDAWTECIENRLLGFDGSALPIDATIDRILVACEQHQSRYRAAVLARTLSEDIAENGVRDGVNKYREGLRKMLTERREFIRNPRPSGPP